MKKREIRKREKGEINCKSVMVWIGRFGLAAVTILV